MIDYNFVNKDNFKRIFEKQLNSIFSLSNDAMILANKAYIQLFIIDLTKTTLIFYDVGENPKVDLGKDPDLLAGMLPAFKEFFKEALGEELIKMDVDLKNSDIYSLVKNNFFFLLRVPNSMKDKDVDSYMNKLTTAFFKQFTNNKIAEYRKSNYVEDYKAFSKTSHAIQINMDGNLLTSNSDASVNFMNIRIIDPNPKEWYVMKKKKGGFYHITSINDPKGQRFYTLDVGDLDKPKIQGLAYVYGYYKPDHPNEKVGTKIDYHNVKMQKVMIEFASIGVSKDDPKDKIIASAMKHYKNHLLKSLKAEHKRLGKNLIDIEITPKEDDYKLILKFK